MRVSKRQKQINEKVEATRVYPILDALTLLKEIPNLKFNESIDISINLGVDPQKSDQNVRGSTSLPHGIGKQSRIAVFAEGADATAASEAGADVVGFEDLIEKVKKDKDIDADVIIATPECMKSLGQLGRILGPKNLMPNPKEGTVTKNVADAVSVAKKGQIRYKTDKGGIIHATIGKKDFEPKKLAENAIALIEDLKKAKPSSGETRS